LSKHGLLRVNESNQACDLLVRAIKSWHSFVWNTAANNRCDLLAIDVGSY
jgi:hypothetical protein